MTVLFDVADHVATITLNRPEKLNSFNEKMTREIAGLAAGARRRLDSRRGGAGGR